MLAQHGNEAAETCFPIAWRAIPRRAGPPVPAGQEAVRSPHCTRRVSMKSSGSWNQLKVIARRVATEGGELPVGTDLDPRPSAERRRKATRHEADRRHGRSFAGRFPFAELGGTEGDCKVGLRCRPRSLVGGTRETVGMQRSPDAKVLVPTLLTLDARRGRHQYGKRSGPPPNQATRLFYTPGGAAWTNASRVTHAGRRNQPRAAAEVLQLGT